MNLARLVIATGFVCLFCGCASIHNSIEMLAAEYGEPVLPAPSDDWYLDHPRTPANFVYGGVKFDAVTAGYAFTKDNLPLIGRLSRLLCIADIPLSAALDTLSLPLAIPATQHEADRWCKIQELKWADFDDDGNQLPAVKSAAQTPDGASESN
jgi:uncharacterized protein YceK